MSFLALNTPVVQNPEQSEKEKDHEVLTNIMVHQICYSL